MISDSMLRKAANRSYGIYADQLEQSYDPQNQHAFSPRFEKKIRRLKRRANHPALYHSLSRAASIILILLVACGTWITVDVEARATFLGWIQDVYETYFVYRFEGDSVVDSSTVSYRPTWLPEGYTEFDVDETESTISVSYQNGDGLLITFQYAQSPNDTDWFIAGEHTELKSCTVNGHSADILIADNITDAIAIMWIDESNTAFYISAFLSEPDLIRIAESIQPTK